jgi:hypothetical protein
MEPGERTIIGGGIRIEHLGDLYAVYQHGTLVRLRTTFEAAYEDAEKMKASGLRVRR